MKIYLFLGLPEVLFHSLTTLCGIYMLLTTIQSTVGVVVVFTTFFLAYIAILLHISIQRKKLLIEDYLNQRSVQCSAAVVQYGLIVMFVLL